MTIRSFFIYLSLLLTSSVLYGFHIEKPRKMEELSHYGGIINTVSRVGAANPEFEAGSALNGINQIGFFVIHSFSHDKTRQISFILWMKQRLEQIGHVIILDHANGIDFTGVAKGGWASIGSRAVPVHDFKKKTTTYIKELQHLYLSISASIRIEETKKLAPLEIIWRQEMFVDASDKENVEIGYKDLVENLIDDLKESNIGYKQTPVFYLYIDTEHDPELKKAFGKYISPPLTTIPENVVHPQDK